MSEEVGSGHVDGSDSASQNVMSRRRSVQRRQHGHRKYNRWAAVQRLATIKQVAES